MAVITLHQFEISPFCDKIRRVLHVKGQPYTTREVSVGGGALRQRRHNPSAKVPLLEHDGRFIPDSTDIARYLERRFPSPPLIPDDPVLAARVHVFEDWADESLYFYELTMRFAWPHNARRFLPSLLAHEHPALRPLIRPFARVGVALQAFMQGMARKPREHILRDIQRHADHLDALLTPTGWLVGDALTLADISVFVMLHCIHLTEEGHAIIASRPALSAWMERVADATRHP